MKALSDIQAEGHSSGRSAFLPSGAGGGAAPTEVVLDFGAAPVHSARFQFPATASAGQKVMMMASAEEAGDELEMDGFQCAARVIATDQVEAFVVAFPGPVSGQRRFNILIG